jgi:hypothetical protein
MPSLLFVFRYLLRTGGIKWPAVLSPGRGWQNAMMCDKRAHVFRSFSSPSRARRVTASPPLPPVLDSGITDGLPLEVRNSIGSAAGQRHDVIFPITGTGTACSPGRWARVFALKFPCYFTGPVFFRRKRDRGQRNRSRDGQPQKQFRGGARHTARVAVIDRAR